MFVMPFLRLKFVDDAKGGKMRWIQTTVNLENHVIVPDLGPEIDIGQQFVEDYISYLTKSPMDLSKPLWELHLLNVKTSDAESVGIFRIHHSLGDGASLISLLLACTRKTSDPQTLPTIPVPKQASSNASSRICWLFLAMGTMLVVIWNTIVDAMMLVATALFLKDTKTPVKGTPGVELTTKHFVHRIVSLDKIKLVKNTMNMTINDVVLGVTQAGLSRYLNRRYGGSENQEETKQKKNNLPTGIRLRATILINVRGATGIQALADMMAKGSKAKWGNCIGYVLFPFNVALRDDPLDYVRQAKAIIDRKKLSLQSVLSFLSAEFIIKLFGVKAAANLSHRLLSNTTMAFSNVIGPVEEISFYGHPIAYIAPSVYGHPHALSIHFQSYVNKMIIVLAVDPYIVPDPHLLFDDLEDSLNTIKDAVMDKGRINNLV